jgi:hypothetical protein
LAILLLLAILGLPACDDDDDDDHDGEDETVISSFGETESHNTGEDCMLCHRDGGGGEGWFAVAGTVYETDGVTPYTSNAVVELYTDPGGGGTRVERIEVDGRGNFFTTEPVDFTGGLYARVIGDVSTEDMFQVVTQGRCNGCHNGTDEAVIEVE